MPRHYLNPCKVRRTHEDWSVFPSYVLRCTGRIPLYAIPPIYTYILNEEAKPTRAPSLPRATFVEGEITKDWKVEEMNQRKKEGERGGWRVVSVRGK